MSPEAVVVSKNLKEVYHVQDHKLRKIAKLHPNDTVEWDSTIKEDVKNLFHKLMEQEIRRSSQIVSPLQRCGEQDSVLTEFHLLKRQLPYEYEVDINPFHMYAKNARIHTKSGLIQLLSELNLISWDIVCFSETRRLSGDAILHGGHRLISSFSGGRCIRSCDTYSPALC